MLQKEKTELTKQKIISLGIKEFGKNGYEKSSLSNICEHGIPKGLLYHNYKSKDDVYLACLEKCYSDFLDYYNNHNDIKNINDYMEVRFDFFRKNKFKAKMIIESLLLYPKKLEKEINKIKIIFDEFNIRCFENILQSVTLRQDVTKKEAIEYFKFLQSSFNVYYSLIAKNEIAEHEKKLSGLLDYMMNGITKR